MTWTYPAGQCTAGVAEHAPWVTRYGNLGDAYQWSANWRAHGGYTDHTPTVGCAVAFQPGSDGAAYPSGHVALVVAVDKLSFTVAEQNFPEGSPWHSGRVCAVGAGVEFLYEEPPGDPMTAAEREDLMRGLVRKNYWDTLERAPSETEIEARTAVGVQHGVDALMSNWYSEPEVQAHLAKRKAAGE